MRPMQDVPGSGFHDDGTRLPLWTDNGLAPQRWIPRWEEIRDDLPLPT